MEQIAHICVADGSAFSNRNIPDRTQLKLPEIYTFAKNYRQQLNAIEFGLAVNKIAAECGFPAALPYDVRIAIQGGVVCAVAGCQVELVTIPKQDLQLRPAGVKL